MQVQWISTLDTALPATAAMIAHWLVSEHPEMVRRMTGSPHAPTAEQVERFMEVQPHFANLAAGLYAREQGLLPASARLPLTRQAAPRSARTGS